jgi:hypothetical protein
MRHEMQGYPQPVCVCRVCTAEVPDCAGMHWSVQGLLHFLISPSRYAWKSILLLQLQTTSLYRRGEDRMFRHISVSVYQVLSVHLKLSARRRENLFI